MPTGQTPILQMEQAGPPSQILELEMVDQDERDRARRELLQDQHEKQLVLVTEENRKLRMELDETKRRQKLQRVSVRKELAKANRMLMALVAAVIIAGFASTPAGREVAWAIVQGIVKGGGVK